MKSKNHWFKRQPIPIKVVIITSIVTIFVSIIPIVSNINKKQVEQISTSERCVLLVHLGEELFSFYIGETAGLDIKSDDFIINDLKYTYKRLNIDFPKTKNGIIMLDKTRNKLKSEKDLDCLNIGIAIGTVYFYGQAIIIPKDLKDDEAYEGEKLTNERLNMLLYERIHNAINDLKNSLLSLGILNQIEQNIDINTQFLPKKDDTKDTYTLKPFKALINSEIRNKFGP